MGAGGRGGALTSSGRRAMGSPGTPGTGAAGSRCHTHTRCRHSGRARCTQSRRGSGSPGWTCHTGTRSPRSPGCRSTCRRNRCPALQDGSRDSAPPIRPAPVHPSVRLFVCTCLAPCGCIGLTGSSRPRPPAHPGPPGSVPPPFPPPILSPAYLALPGSTRPSVRVPAPPHPSSPSPLLTLAPADQAIIALAVDVVALAEAPEDTLVGDVALVAHTLPAQAVPQPRADEGVVVPPAAALQLLTASALRLAFTVLPDVAGVAPAAGGAPGQAPFSQSCGPGPHRPHTCPHHFTCRCRTPWSPCHHRGRGSGSCPCTGTRTGEGRERSPCP